MSKKKRNRRENTKYPALRPELNLKTRFELLDQDYINELPDKQIKHCNQEDCKICKNPETRFVNPKEWLNKFNEEYVNDKLDREDLNNNLHNTKALKKDCDDRNNSRNRCILTRVKASGKIVDSNKINEEDFATLSPEDQLIFKEDLKNHKRKKRIK